MAKLFANNGDPDQTPRSVAFDLGLHCLPITLYGSPDYNGLKHSRDSVTFFFIFLTTYFNLTDISSSPSAKWN